jgi:hypothetical protein
MDKTSPFDRLKQATKQILSVPKKSIDLKSPASKKPKSSKR